MVILLLALVAATMALAFRRGITPILVNFALGGLIAWLWLPTLDWGYLGTVWFGLTLLGLAWLWGLRPGQKGVHFPVLGTWILAGSTLLTGIVVPFATTSTVLHAERYRTLLSVEEKDFDREQILLDQTQVRFVDRALARRAADELLGNDLGLGSRVEVGTMNIQLVDGRLWWVGPFEHQSMFKWFSNRTVPGYVMVSATEYSDARIVLQHDMRIGRSAWFADNLRRYLYLNGFADEGLTDFSFEIDDSGKPFWVVTLLEPRIGFGGHVPVGVAVVDPVSGDVARYGVQEAPAWIDRIQPEPITVARIDAWGRFIHGWINSWAAGRDVIESSSGMSLVYTADGRSVWYTGLQSRGSSDQGTMGFMLVDTRTGQGTFYRRAGITEEAARQVIEGLVQEKRYLASWPIPYLVEGIPTFISILKDAAGNFQMIGLVSYNDRSIAATGRTLREAQRAYVSALRNRGTGEIKGQGTVLTFDGIVLRIAREQVGGENFAVILLDSVPGQGFQRTGTPVSGTLSDSGGGHGPHLRV